MTGFAAALALSTAIVGVFVLIAIAGGTALHRARLWQVRKPLAWAGAITALSVIAFLALINIE